MAYADNFYEIPQDFYPMEAGDKIVDMAAGKKFIIVVTAKGQLFASGYTFYRSF